ESGDEKGSPARFAGGFDRIAFVGCDQLRPETPGPFLLPDEIALAFEAAGQRERPGLVGVPVDVACKCLRVQDLVAAEPVVAPENHGSDLLLGPGDAPYRERSLGVEQVA